MEKIPEPKTILCPLGVDRPGACLSMQIKLLRKVNEIVTWINNHRTLAEMSPEEIEKIGEYVQELDEMEWKKKPWR